MAGSSPKLSRKSGIVYRYMFAYPSKHRIGVAVATYRGDVLDEVWLGVVPYAILSELCDRIPIEAIYFPMAKDIKPDFAPIGLPEGTTVRRMPSSWKSQTVRYRYGGWASRPLMINAHKMLRKHAMDRDAVFPSKMRLLPLTSTLVEQTFGSSIRPSNR